MLPELLEGSHHGTYLNMPVARKPPTGQRLLTMLGHLTRSELFEGTPEEVPQPADVLNCQLLSRLQQRKRKVNHLCMTETSKKPQALNQKSIFVIQTRLPVGV